MNVATCNSTHSLHYALGIRISSVVARIEKWWATFRTSKNGQAHTTTAYLLPYNYVRYTEVPLIANKQSYNHFWLNGNQYHLTWIRNKDDLVDFDNSFRISSYINRAVTYLQRLAQNNLYLIELNYWQYL